MKGTSPEKNETLVSFLHELITEHRHKRKKCTMNTNMTSFYDCSFVEEHVHSREHNPSLRLNIRAGIGILGL